MSPLPFKTIKLKDEAGGGLGTTDVFKHKFKLVLAKFGLIFVIGIGLFTAELMLIQNAATVIKKTRGDIDWVSKATNVLLSISQNSDKAQALESQLQASLPASIDIPTKIIPQLVSTAKVAGVRASIQIASENPAQSGLPASVSIQIRADGSIKNLITFVQALENEQYVLELDSFTIAPLDQSNTSTQQLNANGKIYVR